MHLEGWHLWIALALVAAGAELMHGSLYLLAISLACVVPALADALGAHAATEGVLFALSLLVELPLLARVTKKRTRRLATNAEAIVGMRVKVLKAVNEFEDGVVLLTGEHWKARSLAGEIASGAEARVVQRDGLCLLVLPEER